MRGNVRSVFGIIFLSIITCGICIIRGSVGIPCPGCGITRAYMKL